MVYGNGGGEYNQSAMKQANEARVIGGGLGSAATSGPNVHELLASQEHANEQLHNAITELEQRLSCVLTPQPPMNGGAAQATPESGMVTDRIGRNASATGSAAARVGMLLARLQL